MEIQLRKDVERLAEPGSRKVGGKGHEIAKEYLIERMRSAGLLPYKGSSFELPYEVESTAYTNLAGVLPGQDRELNPILLVAHYDTCGDQPGADDNAAAIAVWFAVLTKLKMLSLMRDIVFLFPDAEEPPRFLTEHMGSSNFYNNQRLSDFHTGLVLDLVGHDVPLDGMEDLIFIFGAESHPAMEALLMHVDTPAGLRNIATLNRYVGDLSDHHILRLNKQPYLFFTCGRWEHYHQDSDTPENLNYTKMARITDYLSALVQHVDTLEIRSHMIQQDPVQMEIKLIERAIGPYLEQMGIPMKNRDDVQRFVSNWVKQHQL